MRQGFSLLNYSSLNAIQQKVEILDLNKILSDIRNDLEVLIQQKGAIIQYNELPKLEGIQFLIYQLFYNLINNSLKFSKESEKPVIKINANTIFLDGIAYSKIVVTDNGMGLIRSITK